MICLKKAIYIGKCPHFPKNKKRMKSSGWDSLLKHTKTVILQRRRLLQKAKSRKEQVPERASGGAGLASRSNRLVWARLHAKLQSAQLSDGASWHVYGAPLFRYPMMGGGAVAYLVSSQREVSERIQLLCSEKIVWWSGPRWGLVWAQKTNGAKLRWQPDNQGVWAMRFITAVGTMVEPIHP